jgi:hypothetical protein
MIKQPALFNGYIVAVLSLYWNTQAVVAQAESFLAPAKSLQTDFFVAIAGALGTVPAEAAGFRDALAKSAPEGFRWTFEAMKDQHHIASGQRLHSPSRSWRGAHERRGV